MGYFMNYAMIDIGSNTVKMTVYAENKTLLNKYTHPTALVSYIENGALSEVGINRLIATLAQYQKIAANESDTRLFAYATASLRGLSNRDAVTDAVKNTLGIVIDVVSGEEEAKLSFDGIAAVSGFDPEGNTVFDLGGGSLEVATLQNGILSAHSYRAGALLMHLQFVKNILPTGEELSAIYSHVQSLAKNDTLPKNYGKALAVGGSLRAFSTVHAHLKGEHYTEELPYTVTREEAIAFLEKVASCDKGVKTALIDLVPTRIHTVASGLSAFLALLDLTGQTAFTVVSGGTREGYLMKITTKETKL